MSEFIHGVLSATFIAGLSLALTINMTEPHKRIVKHGCAEYDTQTGNFKWINKEKNNVSLREHDERSTKK